MTRRLRPSQPPPALHPHVERAVLGVADMTGAAAVGLAALDVRTGAVVPLAASDPRVEELRAVEAARGAGPELEASRTGEATSSNLTVEPRWPVFAQRARELGFGGVRSVRAGSASGPWSAVVTGYAALPEAVPSDPLRRAADVLAASLAAQDLLDASTSEVGELRRGLDTRAAIGQAVGILMERLRITDEAAFDVLRDVSQRRNVKLREIAQHVVDTGELLAAPREVRRGITCLACGEPLPTSVVRVGGVAEALGYTCPHCEKSIEFAPVSVLASPAPAVRRLVELLP